MFCPLHTGETALHSYEFLVCNICQMLITERLPCLFADVQLELLSGVSTAFVCLNSRMFSPDKLKLEKLSVKSLSTSRASLVDEKGDDLNSTLLRSLQCTVTFCDQYLYPPIKQCRFVYESKLLNFEHNAHSLPYVQRPTLSLTHTNLPLAYLFLLIVL
jgi:hypothetical protein